MFVYVGFRWRVNKDATFKEKFQAKVIQWYTKFKYYHVILGINNKYISATPTDGLIYESIDKLEDVTDYEFYKLKLSIAPLTKYQLYIFKDFIQNQIGKKYDWLGIINKVFTIFRDNSNKWFCSEIVTKLLQMLYVKEVLDYEPFEITPAKLFHLLEHKLEKLSFETICQHM